MSPALAGKFLTTGPPGKSQLATFSFVSLNTGCTSFIYSMGQTAVVGLSVGSGVG